MRGVLGTEEIGVVGESGRSLDTLLERSMPSKLVPARPNDESSGGGGVSARPCSDIEPNEVSMVAVDGERGRLAPNSPRNADTATDGGRIGGGEAERREGAGEEVVAEAVWA